MTSFDKTIYLSAIGAAQALPTVGCIYEEGTNYKYTIDEFNRVIRHDGHKCENTGFPLDSAHVFYSLTPLDK